MVNKWLKIVQHWATLCHLLPCYCLLCLKPSQRDIALCQSCERQLPWLTTACVRCALPIAFNERECGECLRSPPPFDLIQALFDYVWPVKEFIADLKYQHQLHFAKLLGRLMAQTFTPRTPVDCIIPMPLAKMRQQQRGFNQTIELARVIAKYHQLPLHVNYCFREGNKKAQSSLSARQRKHNVTANLFTVKQPIQGKHILVIEDVVTTGATASAFTRALKQAGAATVEIWACCRTGKN